MAEQRRYRKESEESGYGSRTNSNTDLRTGNSTTTLTLLPVIGELGEPTNAESDAHPNLSLSLYPVVPCDLQEHSTLRRGSAESNPSCPSDASTPASTRALLPDQSKKQTDLMLHLRDDTGIKRLHQLLKLPSDLAKLNYADEIILRDAVRCKMPTFVRNTDFKTLYSHLYSRKLLHETDYATLTSMSSDKDRGNHLYMQILPGKGRHTYRRLYECLKKETEHTGHGDLVRILNKALKDRHQPQSSSDSSPTESNQSLGKDTLCCTLQ